MVPSPSESAARFLADRGVASPTDAAVAWAEASVRAWVARDRELLVGSLHAREGAADRPMRRAPYLAGVVLHLAHALPG